MKKSKKSNFTWDSPDWEPGELEAFEKYEKEHPKINAASEADYETAYATDRQSSYGALSSLKDEVNIWVRKGYKPTGAPVYVYDHANEEHTYSQALYRPEAKSTIELD